jgi:hypothetical protein
MSEHTCLGTLQAYWHMSGTNACVSATVGDAEGHTQPLDKPLTSVASLLLLLIVVAGGGGALLTVRRTAGPSPWDRRGGTAGAGDGEGDGEGDGDGDGRAPGAGDGWLTDPNTAGDGDVAPTMGTMPTRKGVPRGVMATGSTPPWAWGDAWAVEPYAAGE